MKALEGKVDGSTPADSGGMEDYSSRLGVADGVESLEHFERRGVRLSPWVWFGSLVGKMDKATIDKYPDLISAGVTVRWCCPVCKEVMYVKKEELMSHLNECVKWSVWNKRKQYTPASTNTFATAFYASNEQFTSTASINSSFVSKSFCRYISTSGTIVLTN